MPAFSLSTSPAVFRELLPSARGGLAALGLALHGTIAVASAQTLAPSQSLKVAYLAELPVSWRTGLTDPLRSIARSLGTAFARPIDPEYPLPADNILPAESWEELSRAIQLGSTELFPLQAYEWVEHGRELNLKPLLLATRNGRWQTRFLLLSRTSSDTQTLLDLRDRTILIHRDGCGNLVDYWLDTAIAVGTGMPRKVFARYQTVTHAREAVLPVFFGEADACVVSESAYQAVCAQNPIQIPQRLNVTLMRSEEMWSGEMPAQVVACKVDLPVDVQRRVLEKAKELTWDFGDQSGGFAAAEEVAFDHLRRLLAQRASIPAAAQPLPVPRAPNGRFQTSSPARTPPRQP